MTQLVLNARVLKLAQSATLAAKAKAKALSDQGISVVSLGTGEPDFETPKLIKEAAKRALETGVSRYTAIRGTDELVASMRAKFLRDQKLTYGINQVLSTVGAKAAISQAIDAVVENGDEVILLAPYWVSYIEQVRWAGGVPVVVPSTAEQGYVPPLESIQAAIGPKTKLIILNSPNNPTGMVWSESYLRALMKLFEGTGIWVISDEIYEHLVFDDHVHVSPATFSKDAYERTVVITGASKGYAMTGWRVGIAGGSERWISAMSKIQEQRYTCIASIAQASVAYALTEPPELKIEIEKMRSSYENRRDFVMEKIPTLKDVSCVKPQGAFYALLDFGKWMGKEHRGGVIADDNVLADRILGEAHVALVAGSAFGAPGCLRMSLASSPKDLEEGMLRIRNWLT